jgi:uncharacterized DUF497 family protein
MKYFVWSVDKNARLKHERNISFDEIIFYIERGHVLDIVEHPNQERYSGQRIFIVNINDFAYIIPFVEAEAEIILITIIPSRKATSRYLRGRDE